jgi:hypothetical protein
MAGQKSEKPKPPEWWDEAKLIKVMYEVSDYFGWVIDLGDGTCRYVNQPLLGEDGPNWGDRVKLKKLKDNTFFADHTEIIERYKRKEAI